MPHSSRDRKTEMRAGIIRRGRPVASYVPHQAPLIPDRQQGLWLSYQLKLQGFTLVTLAECAGVSFQMVHMVIYGKKTSARVQKIIARSLGYDSWSDLLGAREGVAA